MTGTERAVALTLIAPGTASLTPAGETEIGNRAEAEADTSGFDTVDREETNGAGDGGGTGAEGASTPPVSPVVAVTEEAAAGTGPSDPGRKNTPCAFAFKTGSETSPRSSTAAEAVAAAPGRVTVLV